MLLNVTILVTINLQTLDSAKPELQVWRLLMAQTIRY